MFSIIIPTHNRSKLLEKTLKSIKQNLGLRNNFEILIIDNASNDATKEISEHFTNVDARFKYFYVDKIGLHEGRNYALRVAKGDVFCYLDDDVELLDTWFEGIEESFDETDVVLVGGKNLPNFESKPPDWIYEIWENKKNIGYLSIIDLGDEKKYIDSYLVYGCNFAISRRVLIECEGFHPDGYPKNLIIFRGDGESYVSNFIMKKGYKTVYNPKVSVLHYVPFSRLNFEYFKNRAYNQGISDSFTYIRSILGSRRKILFNLLMHSINLIKHFKFLTQRKNTFLYHEKGYFFHHLYCLFNDPLLKHVLKKNYL